MRELIKLEFDPRYIVKSTGEQVRVSRSTIELNNRDFAEFLERITD